jgi:hypothetical protein
LKGKNFVEETIPPEHKKLVKYLSKQEKLAKKKKEVKREEKRKPFLEDLVDDIPNVFAQKNTRPDIENVMQPENDNNLLLKFDTLVITY